MKNFISLIFVLFTAQWAISQCTVVINTPTTNVECGDCFTLTAVGTSTSSPLSENFNGSSLGPGWTSNVTPQYSNPCGAPPNGSIAAWFGLGTQPREMETVAFDVSCGGDVCFEMKYATQGGSGNCEGPDQPNEGVRIQYSINGGTSWVDIQYWPPNGGYDPMLTQWNNYCVTIPTVAETTSTKFRWFQDVGSGANFDHWGIDDVNISAINCQPYHYDWLADGTENNADTIFCLGQNTADYNVIFTNGIDDTCSATITINAGLTPDFTYDAPCEGEAVTFTNTSIGLFNNSKWIFLNGTDTIVSQNATYIFPPGSNHDVELLIEDLSGSCSGSITKTIVEVPRLEITVVNQVDATCYTGDDGIVTVGVTAGNVPYNYSWTGSASINPTADDLFAGSTTVTVTDDRGCVETETINVDEPNPLSMQNISEDTIICIDDPVNLFAQGSGGSSPFTYTWMSNGQVEASGSNVTVTPSSAPTEYTVILGEQCGSPEDTAYVVVNYPGEVDPTLVPDVTGGCYPVEVSFTNSTNTTEGIDYTIWTYSDGETDTVAGDNNTAHEFSLGVWGVDMEIVSDRGCRYFKTYEDLIEGFPYPEASFYVNPNPVSIFESKVIAYSQSGSDIISYEWFAEGANPDYSSIQNPNFEYPKVIENYPLVLVVENAYGCTDTLEKLVRVENVVTIFSPNTFTPDGDGLNDTWNTQLLGIDAQNFQLQIFNRWGEIVFESLDPDGAWDGTYGGEPVKSGTYMWIIRAFDFETDNKHEFNGTVNLLR